MKLPQLDVPTAYHTLLGKVGGTLLRFASEDRSLDRDALYELWAESDSRCWVDTEQQARVSSVVPGLPPGTTAVAAEAIDDGPPTVRPDFAESSGYGRDLSSFESEIDAWRDSRHPSPATAHAPAPRALQRQPTTSRR